MKREGIQTSEMDIAVRDMLDSVYALAQDAQYETDQDAEQQKTAEGQKDGIQRQNMPEICADLIDVEEIREHDNQFIQVQDLYDENDVEQ